MLTKHDKTVMRLMMEAAQEVGYQPRDAGDGVVGVIAPLKVCRLLEAIHKRFVKELEKEPGPSEGDHMRQAVLEDMGF